MQVLLPPDPLGVGALASGLGQRWCSEQVCVATEEVFTVHRLSKLFTVAPERCLEQPELAGNNTILKPLTSMLMWAMISYETNAFLSKQLRLTIIVFMCAAASLLHLWVGHADPRAAEQPVVCVWWKEKQKQRERDKNALKSEKIPAVSC